MKVKPHQRLAWKSIPYIWMFLAVAVCGINVADWFSGSDVPIGSSAVVIVIITLITLYATIDDLKKENAEQQNQIDELKRELESMKQNG